MKPLRILPLGLLGCCLLPLPVYAKEIVAPAATGQAQARENSGATTSPAPAELPPPAAPQGETAPLRAIEIAPPATLPAATAAATAAPDPAAVLRQQKLELIPQRLNHLRSTVRTTTTSKGLLDRLLSSSSSPIDLALLQEMDLFTLRHVALPETAEVYYLKGLVHQRIDQPQAATLDWLLLQVIYPDSSFVAEAKKRLKELRGDALRKLASLLDGMQQVASRVNGDRDARLASFLRQLGTQNNDASFAAPIAAACDAFLASNETWTEEDAIVHARARQSMMLDHQVAIYYYNQLLALYPASPLRPDSLLAVGNIQRSGLRQYDQAVKSYARLIQDYPDAPESKLAHEAQANTYENELRDYPNALKSYQAIVTKYGTDPMVARSLRAMALIYQNRVNQPVKAIESYLQLAELFPSTEGLDALNKAGRIAQFTLRDWKRAMDINERIIALVPGSEDAVKALFGNAEIAEDKLKDKGQAKRLYGDFLARHPKHRLAADAAKRLAALNPPPAAAPPAAAPVVPAPAISNE